MSEQNTPNEQNATDAQDVGTAQEKTSIREFLPSGKKPLRSVDTPVLAHIPLHRPELPCKLIFVGNVHHRDSNAKINTTTLRFVRQLVSNDAPYKRSFTVGSHWVELDTAWIKTDNVGYIIIRNDGGRPFQVVPTPEQMAEAKAKVIDIGYMLMDFQIPKIKEEPKRRLTMWDKIPEETPVIQPPILPLWFVIPGESHQGNPSPQHRIYLRCQHGEVTVTIVAVPK